MCHFSRRAKRHLHHFIFHSCQPEHHGHRDRSDWGGTFMPGHGHPGGDPFEGQPGFGGGWGVRRPLRFLAHKLDLDQKQVAELARILDELKIERAQAEVDDRRARAELADVILGATFDADKAGAAGERRVQSAAKLRDALTRTLAAIHAVLSPEQRERFAYLVRTGVLAF
jgi:Spy/CpxP family protein refolding chaperone